MRTHHPQYIKTRVLTDTRNAQRVMTKRDYDEASGVRGDIVDGLADGRVRLFQITEETYKSTIANGPGV